MSSPIDDLNKCADELGAAAIRSRAGIPPSFTMADRVDQMTLLWAILVELREVNSLLNESLNRESG